MGAVTGVAVRAVAAGLVTGVALAAGGVMAGTANADEIRAGRVQVGDYLPGQGTVTAVDRYRGAQGEHVLIRFDGESTGLPLSLNARVEVRR